jgi:hypothetical protein
MKSKLSISTSAISSSIALPKTNPPNFSINQTDAMRRKRIMLGQSANTYMVRKPKPAANNLNN